MMKDTWCFCCGCPTVAGEPYCESCSPLEQLQTYAPPGKHNNGQQRREAYAELREMLRKKPKYIILIAIYEREDD